MLWFDLLAKRPFAWMVVGVLGLMGSTVLAFAVWTIVSGELGVALLILPIAAFFVVGVMSVWLRFLSRAVPHHVTEEKGPQGSVTVLWLHRARSWVSLPLLSLVAGGLLLFALVAFADGQAGVGWFVLALGLLFVSFLPDTIRALVRRPRLELSASGIRYRGQSVDAELGWDDVWDVGGNGNARGGTLLLSASSGTGRARAGRIIWRFEDKPLGSEIAVTSRGTRNCTGRCECGSRSTGVSRTGVASWGRQRRVSVWSCCAGWSRCRAERDPQEIVTAGGQHVVRRPTTGKEGGCSGSS